MLTIHTPIELTVNPSILQVNDNFTERLTGNYQVIGSGLEMEDMLHFVSQPPEIYLAEGGMTALIENKNIRNTQNLKMDVINNVLNRILVSDTYRMTYQDQVFIESVLKRMGVSNVQEFIRQVQNVRQETKNVSHLTELYWSENGAFTKLIEYRQMQAKQRKEESSEDESGKGAESVLWLHQKIMNRLQTGAIYQEIRNYLSMSSHSHETISRAEMQVSEQTVTAQNILLNKLRNYTMMEEQPLVYHHVNAYEMGDEMITYEDNRQTMSQMVQAVLLNALHQMYALRMEEISKQDNVWYRLAGAVYQAAENTFQRFDTYHNQFFLTGKDADVYSKTLQQYQKNEIQTIQQLFRENAYNSVTNVSGETLTKEQLLYLQQEETQEQPEYPVNKEFTQTIENVHKTEVHGQQIQALTQQEILLKNQLEQINLNNVHNSRILKQLNMYSEGTGETGRINRERAKADALKVLSEPEEVLMSYLERQTVVEQQEEIEKERLIQIFGKETVKIFETLEKYQKSPQQMERMTAYGRGEAKLLQDIRLHEQNVQLELTHKTQELVQNTIHETETKQLLREYLPEQIQQVNQEVQRRVERVEMVYKQEETTIEEEMLEEIRNLHRTGKVINEQTTEQIIEKNVSQEIINSRINEFQTRQNEEIVRMVTDKMQQQLSNISEQVYGKLEKRMDTERRRRGL